MNRERLKRLLKFIKEVECYVEGGKLECAKDGIAPCEQKWVDVENPDFFDFGVTFRIKGAELILNDGRFTDEECEELFKNMRRVMNDSIRKS